MYSKYTHTADRYSSLLDIRSSQRILRVLAEEERPTESVVDSSSSISIWENRDEPCTSKVAFSSVSELSTRVRNRRI